MKLVRHKTYPRLEQDLKYEDMYRIRWAKDDLSDMVNYTRGKEYIRCYEETQSRTARRQAGNGT